MAESQRVLVVIGTRPEGIKLAPVCSALRAHPDLETRIALTGQHTDLMDQVLDVFELRPDWDLGIMREGQNLYDVAEGCMRGLRTVLEEYQPHMILVQGDTASVFFGALVGYFERSRVGHVEAGLRSGDKWRPYPEEIFRRLASVISDAHFAPTPAARDNLLREGIDPNAVFVTGNTVVDALLSVAERLPAPRNPELRLALATGHKLVLMTAHRRESFGAPLREAFGAVAELVARYPDVVVLYPVHPNPNVLETANEILGDVDRVLLTEPLDYLDLVNALKRAVFVLTDSGGIQEEAPTFGTPVLVLRDVTERPEGIHAGVAELVGTDRDRILAAAARLLDHPLAPGATRAANPYGDGHAGERIADAMHHVLTGAPRSLGDWDPDA